MADDSLIKSYQAKLRAGQKPTAGEKKAYQSAIYDGILEQLRAVTPGFFNDLFGVSNKQRNDWEDRYQFPCGRGRKAIDIVSVIKSIKELISVNRKYLGTGKATGEKQSDDDIDIIEAKRLGEIERRKKTETQREKLQIELAALKRKMIDAEEVREVFELNTSVWVRISKQLQKSGHEDAWEIVESGLVEARQSFESEMASPISDAEYEKLEKEILERAESDKEGDE